MYPWCQIIVFMFDVAQGLVDLYVQFMNAIGITTPALTLAAGSFFGCDVYQNQLVGLWLRCRGSRRMGRTQSRQRVLAGRLGRILDRRHEHLGNRLPPVWLERRNR